jgi:hypothetical protein
MPLSTRPQEVETKVLTMVPLKVESKLDAPFFSEVTDPTK